MKLMRRNVMMMDPTPIPSPGRPKVRQRGSALALTILVILVLTVVGLAVAYFTQTEDRISGNARLVKSALYAADTGLRSGEHLLVAATNAGTTIQDLINQSLVVANCSAAAPISLPGGKTAIALCIPSQPFSAAQPAYIHVPAPSAVGSREIARYSLYVRNNDEDPGRKTDNPGGLNNSDDLINLVSVGQVIIQGPKKDGTDDIILATKILEEQLMISAQGNEFGAQKGSNQGGTGSGTKG